MVGEDATLGHLKRRVCHNLFCLTGIKNEDECVNTVLFMESGHKEEHTYSAHIISINAKISLKIELFIEKECQKYQGVRNWPGGPDS